MRETYKHLVRAETRQDHRGVVSQLIQLVLQPQRFRLQCVAPDPRATMAKCDLRRRLMRFSLRVRRLVLDQN